ncbi:MAG: hypothetical protein ACE5HC_07940 [Candidatus Binatia bacterium]
MIKEIRVQDKPVRMYSWDGGRSWCSSRKAILSFKERREKAFTGTLTLNEAGWIDSFDTIDSASDLERMHPPIRFSE